MFDLLLAAAFSAVAPRTAERYAQRQEEIIKVMCVLPGKYRYAQVEAAINAADVPIQSIYESLSANERTVALVRFYEALYGPSSK